MKNKSHPSMGGMSEQNECSGRNGQHVEVEGAGIGTTEEQMLLDYLVELGFAWEEAVKLIHLREHLYENPEMRQRIADDCRTQFARWLYEQGEIREA